MGPEGGSVVVVVGDEGNYGDSYDTTIDVAMTLYYYGREGRTRGLFSPEWHVIYLFAIGADGAFSRDPLWGTHLCVIVVVE